MKLQLKRSNVLDGGKAKEPTPPYVEYGELCVNYNTSDPALFIKDSNDNIIRIAGKNSVGSGSNPSGPNLPDTGNNIGDVFFNTGDLILYYWDGSEWVPISSQEHAADIFVGTFAEVDVEIPAAKRRNGLLLWETEEGNLFLWYEDPDTAQWVVAVPGGGGNGDEFWQRDDVNAVLSPRTAGDEVSTTGDMQAAHFILDQASADVTLAAEDPAADRIYTFPDAGADRTVTLDPGTPAATTSYVRQVTDAGVVSWEELDAGGIEDAPSDGQLYGRQDGDWELVPATPPDVTINYNGAAAWGLISMNAQLLAGMNCKAASSDDGYGFQVTFDNPMPNANYAITACAATRVGVVSDVAWTNNTPNGFTLYVKDQSGAAVQAGVSFAVHATNALPPRGGTGADGWATSNGTVMNAGGFNISGMTRNSVGNYTYTFTNPMPTANYAVTGGVNDNTANGFVVCKNRSATDFTVETSEPAGNPYDAPHTVVVHATNAQLPDTITMQMWDDLVARVSALEGGN